MIEYRIQGYRHRKSIPENIILEASKEGASIEKLEKKLRYIPQEQVNELVSLLIAIGFLQLCADERSGHSYRTTKCGLHHLKVWNENKKLLEPYFAPKPRFSLSWFP